MSHVLDELGEAGFARVLTTRWHDGLSDLHQEDTDRLVASGAIPMKAADLGFRAAIDLAYGRDVRLGRQPQCGPHGMRVVEQPGFGVWLCDTDGSREWWMSVAVFRAPRLELAHAIAARRFVLVDGRNHAIEARVACLQNRE